MEEFESDLEVTIQTYYSNFLTMIPKMRIVETDSNPKS